MAETGKTILSGGRGVLKMNGIEVADLDNVSLNDEIAVDAHQPCGAWGVKDFIPLGYAAGMSAVVTKRRGVDQSSRGWKATGIKSFIEMSDMTATVYDTADETNVYKVEGVRYLGFQGGLSAGSKSSEALNFAVKRIKEESEV